MADLMNTQPNIGQELLNVPMGDMIKEMAFAIAEAQLKLDANSIEVAEMMGGLHSIKETDGDGKETISFKDSRVYFGTQTVTVAEAKVIAEDKGYEGVKGQITTAYGTLADDKLITVPARLSMLELGFSPTFYQFVDTIIEVKISISYTQSGEKTNTNSSGGKIKNVNHGGLRGLLFGGKRNKVVTTSQVNSSYSQKYSYTAEGSSLLRTKLVPIPPPAILEERIRLQMEIQKSGKLETPVPTP